MIDIKNLTEKDMGRKVIYSDGCRKPEEGVITSWNTTYVFVRYGKDFGSQGTYPRELTFAFNDKDKL